MLRLFRQQKPRVFLFILSGKLLHSALGRFLRKEMEEAKNSVEVYLSIVLVEFDELGEVKEKVCDNFFELALTQNLENRMEFFKVALGVFQPA